MLTAGIALGHAGEWESFCNYLTNSYNSARLGQPLIAAVMQSCLLCSRADKALELFESLVSGPVVSGGGGEWQYGGEYHALNPLCRDLAMRALGDSDGSENAGERALELYQQVQNEEVQISVDALCGVVKACERDGRWQEAVQVFTHFLDHCQDSHWLVDGDSLTIVPIDETVQDVPMPVDILKRSLPQIGDCLASVMRSCNAAGKFGMALLCCRLLDEELPISAFDDTRSSGAFISDDSEVVRTLVPVLFRFENTEDLLVAAMVALCGVNCNQFAEELYSVADARMDQLVEDGFQVQELFNARECNRFAQSLASKSQVLPVPWESAHRHMSRLISACASTQRNNQDLTDHQRKILSAALGTTMRSCTGAGQPETGLFLAKRMESILVPKAKRTYSVRGAMASFLGYQDSDAAVSAGKDSLFSDTTLLAEAISAYRAMGSPDEALELLTTLPETFDDNSSSEGNKGVLANDAKWAYTQVVNEAIYLLSDENRHDVAKALFRQLEEVQAENQYTLTAMAEVLEKEEKWDEIGKLYQHAVRSGLLTDSLAFTEMKALVESSQEGLLPNLRSVTRDISTQRGLREKQWVESHFWRLERRLGETVARLLMWWNDAATSKDMKLQFALEQFAMRQEAGLTPKNDITRHIVREARHYQNPSELIPFSREEWLVLLRNVLVEAEASILWNKSNFVEDACLSLLYFGGKRECVEFASDAVARGVRITKRTVTAASEAAQSEGLQADELFMLNHNHNSLIT